MRILAGAAFLSACLAACAPIPPPPGPVYQGDAPRHRRLIDVKGPFLSFHGRADQMGDLNQVAATFRVIAIDADPKNRKFTRQQLATLRAGGRNIVLGFLNIGFCDRTQTYWTTAPDGLLPCVANMDAQIGERDGRPQQVWMDLEEEEYQRLIGEYEAPAIERAGVDGFVLDGLELLDRGADDAEAPCDKDCVEGGLSLVAGLRREFPDLVFVMQGGLSWQIRGAHVDKKRLSSLIDGVVGEEVYTPSYNAEKEANLLEWETMAHVAGHPVAVFTQDYVKSCRDLDWARTVVTASRSHGFSPAVGLSPVNRGPMCNWTGL